MPLTPLHLAAGLPVRRWVNLKAFILVNLLIDIEPAVVLFFGMDNLGYRIHGWVHTLDGVTGIALLVVFLGLRSQNLKGWVIGTLWGAYSHLFLDALVHWDVQPFGESLKGNPLYLDAYHEVSLLCAGILVYYLTQWVRSLGISEVTSRWFKRM